MVEWNKIGADKSEAEIELYDYQNDPLETKNIAASNDEIVNSLRAKLEIQQAPKPQWKPGKSSTKKEVERETLFKRRDFDEDGFLTLDEFMRGQPDPEQATSRFPKFDGNNDGVLSREEFVGN